jgi:hypothetical protein
LRIAIAGGLALLVAIAVPGAAGNSGWAEQAALSLAGGEIFADTVLRWNGNIFWEPASESSNAVTRFGDEARAVFGPIPEGDCGSPAAKILPVEVDGNVVDLVPNSAKPGRPLEFEHRDVAGQVVKWTDTIAKCDKPSLAGTVTYCGLNSRLARIVRGNVEWLFLCRKSNSSREVASNPYWQRSDQRFALLGTIGFNSSSGEIVFFDGRKDRTEFDWSKPFVPPGGRSYADSTGRAAAAALYDPTFQIRCHSCHDNKSPYVVDPHAEQSRIGYLLGEDDPRAHAFSLGSYLPERPRLEDAPFRVVGSGYTSAHKGDIARARTVRDPTGNCTTCHTLTTQMTGKRLAADAVAREPFVSNPSWAQTLVLQDERKTYARIDRHRTDWARRGGGGKIHPWMVPGHGNELTTLPPEISAADWQKLSDCLWEAGGPECGYRPLYTPCPAPEVEGENSKLTDATIEVLALPPDERGEGRMLRLSWKYLNDYGAVPERDDVRFNVAIRERPISTAAAPPENSEYPSMDEAKGAGFVPFKDAIGMSASAKLIQNTSYAGHIRWTDPEPATSPRTFELYLPAACNERYLLRIVPKRFCFDQSNIVYGSADHLLYADVKCR